MEHKRQEVMTTFKTIEIKLSKLIYTGQDTISVSRKILAGRYAVDLLTHIHDLEKQLTNKDMDVDNYLTVDQEDVVKLFNDINNYDTGTSISAVSLSRRIMIPYMNEFIDMNVKLAYD